MDFSVSTNIVDTTATIMTEIERRRRVVDMMLSMHSVLRDRYKRYAAALDIAILAGSTVLASTTLLDPHLLSYLHVSGDSARVVLGATSVAMFFLSIVSLLIDWKEKSARHRRAGTALWELKARERCLGTHPSEVAVDDYFHLYDATMAEIEPVPERQFIPLKARHRRKTALSRDLDRFPGTPVQLLRARLLFAACRAAFSRTREETR